MNIYLCGVFKGKFTGQMQTLFGLRDALENNFNLKIINYPKNSLFFILEWFIFASRLFLIMGSLKKNSTFYIVINRSRLSFWLRDLPIFLLSISTKSKIICHLVGSDIERFIYDLSYIEKKIIKIIYKKINCWIVLGNSMNNQVSKIYKYLEISNSSICFNKNELISYHIGGYYPNEADRYINNDEIHQKLNDFEQNIKIGYMSNLIEEKGIVEFIEAIIYMKEDLKYEFTAWIAGIHMHKPSKRLKNALEKASSKNYIDIVGSIKGEEKWKKLLDTNFFILPSYYKSEALPLSLVEAMRSGCCCISSSVGEIKDLLDLERGVIIEKVTTQNLVSAIDSCFKNINKSKKSANESYFFVKKKFSHKNFQKKVIQVLNNI